MRYKIVSIILIIFLVFSCIILNNYYKKDLSYVYHQHLEDSSDESECENVENCSHLPIVNLIINNQTIPTKNDIKDYIIGKVEVFDNGNKVNHLKETPKDITNARIRYRGRSSLGFDKKNMLIKFVNEKDEKIKKEFLGMPSDNEWVLHGPFIDKTLIRNYMWYNIGQEIMDASPKTRIIELYIDNEYQGVYVAIESVTQSEKSRVKMDSFNKKSIATSYLIQLDDEIGTPLTNINSFSSYTYNKYDSLNLVIKYPNEKELTEEVRKYIYDDFSQFEKLLYSYDYKEYKKYIDIDSFVNYFIINEFTQNYDANKLSTYIYKNVSGKYKMYIWDFNSANNNYSNDFLEEGKQRFDLNKGLWFEMLLKDPDFVEEIIKKYKELRKTYLSDEYLNNYIDKTVEYLGSAIDRNFEIWGYTFSEDYKKFKTNYMPTSYSDAVNQLKSSIQKRAEWMDENIYTLRQYSHESKNKKYNIKVGDN